jgi:hypothetical protein
MIGNRNKETMMPTDIYTKAVLTVIALGLLLLNIQSLVRPSFAQIDRSEIQKVQICDGYSCLSLSPRRNTSSTGVNFLSFSLPVATEAEQR